ncbi:tetratricopeptide repeat protein [Streptomyces sp. NPDC089919]|uniref:tetratricopeptide repeat protein n=1 Tax=Streptomyces sp. NPDC089919 TaxID=3155188 RepID=UPI00344434B9
MTVAEIGLGSAAEGAALEADPLAAVADLGRSVMQHRRAFLGAAFTAAAVGLPLAYDHEAVAATFRAVGKIDRQTEALLLVTCARAYGANGQGARAARALLAAEDAVTDTREAVPAYAAASGPVTATVASHIGKTLTLLKDHTAAERHYRRSLAGRTPDTYQLKHGLTMADLGRSVAGQHRYEEAVGLWAKALDFMGGAASDRNRKALRGIQSVTAGYRKRGVSGAAGLNQRATELLST